MEWTRTERSGQRAFLLIEAVGLFIVAPLLAVVAGLGGLFEESLSEKYMKCAAFSGAYIGVLSVPISLVWAVLISELRDWHPKVSEFGRLLLMEVGVLALFVVLTVALGPLDKESPLDWTDLRGAGVLLAISSVFWWFIGWLLIPSARRGRDRRLALNQAASSEHQ